MIVLDHVTKTYHTVDGPRRVLDDVSVAIPTDRNIGILGGNGSGKSTLLRIIARAEAPTRGRVYSNVRISWPMAFSGGFDGKLSALDNIRFVSRIYGADWRRVAADVEAFAELGGYLRMPVRTFSSGMRARLSVALSLAIRFDVYLIDEIPGVGDARFQKRFGRAFAALREQACMILVSHRVQSINRFCDMAYLLRDGRLRAFDDVPSAIEAYQAL